MTDRRVMAVKSGGREGFAEWQACFARLDPTLELVYWEEALQRPDSIDYALVWDPDPGCLARMARLRVIFGSGAGVDGILLDPDLPRHVPLVRMAIPEATQRMGEFCCWAVLSLLKDARRMAIAQAARDWDYFEAPGRADLTTVGIMGLGTMGARSAAMLQGIGFRTIGWSRRRKDLPGVESYAGEAELPAFLARTDILVCLLPATPETRRIIRAETLALLPRGAGYVGVGRGMHHDLGDILAALDSGQLSGAMLDVFETEPLPADHPLWAHPRATITPHVASLPTRLERAGYVARSIAGFERGEALPNLYDPARGY
ncbi:2-hydroxyacid dehydrogenase [Paracraurococcus lichenis]|uniref:Glyoxylate/hydroxypyruvate reductase A n=1 Tax=Paracraurococcus lichenis TaxID=3064888 RepID=A0ABT9DWQ0_9PROT|nr:glyoxylate/hydroxypyruvate reductase A [Paracraurococcus sp. LOR1-02]MDO9708303.1 glyoxylate/hydroxypyruvate reductase A [Paracraurococcus sp. LOR1-02]